METIRVPKPAPEAFHKNRRVSDLLLSQVAHFQHVAQKQGLRIDPEVARDVHTEGGAARFIAIVTRSLRKGVAGGRGKVVAMERPRGAASEAANETAASGTVRRIAAKAETSKPTKKGGTAANKPKTGSGRPRASAKGKAKPRKRS